MSIITVAMKSLNRMVRAMDTMDAMDTIDTIRPLRFVDESQGPEGNVLARLWHFYCARAAKRRSRLALGELSADLLKDIGLTEAEARREAAVPFWR